ncbi:MAG: DUF4271 domain-containing protein [Marinilabilia sp.]
MSSTTRVTYVDLPQTPDSVGVEINPSSVVVPGEVSIKVDRPRLKTFDFEGEDTLRQEDPSADASQSPAVTDREVPGDPSEDTPTSDVFFPDTLDSGLSSDWYLSSPGPEFWHASSDSVWHLPLDYFSSSEAVPYRDRNAERGTLAKTSQAEETSFDGDDLSNRDTAFGGNMQFEEIDVNDPSLTTSKEFDNQLLQQDWFLVVLVTFVAITGFIRFRWHRYLSDVFSAVVFSNVANKMQTTTYKGGKRLASFWLGFLFYAHFSLLIFETMRLYEYSLFSLEGWRLLLALFAFLVVVFTAKIVVYRFVGWLFKVGKATSEYLYQSSVMSKAFGVMLLPLVVLYPFLEPEARDLIPKVGFTVFILLYVMQIFRGIGSNLRNTLSGYYIILYLCALEILPLSIIYKVLFN